MATKYTLFSWDHANDGANGGITWATLQNGKSYGDRVEDTAFGEQGWNREDKDVTNLQPRIHEKTDYGNDHTLDIIRTDLPPNKTTGAVLRVRNTGGTASDCSCWFVATVPSNGTGHWVGETGSPAGANRLGFWIKPYGFTQTNYVTGSNAERGHLGTYLCWPGGGLGGEDCPVEANGHHYYHHLWFNPDAWIYMQIDGHPQHKRGGPTPPGNEPAGGSHPYLESLGTFYLEHWHNGTVNNNAFLLGSMEFWQTDQAENQISICSPWVGYWPGTGKWEICFADSSFAAAAYPGGTAISTFEIRWSTSPITNANFSSATIIEPEYNELGTSNQIRRNDDYQLMWTRFDLPAGTEADNSTIYFAIKDVSATANGDGHNAPDSNIRTIDYQLSAGGGSGVIGQKGGIRPMRGFGLLR